MRINFFTSTNVSAITYCSKDNKFCGYGDPSTNKSEKGRRNDLEQAQQDIRDGMSIYDFADKHFSTYIRYQRGIRSYFNEIVHAEPRNFKSNVTVYWGPTGLGKTRKALHEAGSSVWFYGSDGWFDGYCGQESVIFDDFGGHEFKLTYLLKLLDRYPMHVRVKGSFVNWRPRRIFITSNTDPRLWYMASPHHQEALKRRLDTIEEFREEWTPDVDE